MKKILFLAVAFVLSLSYLRTEAQTTISTSGGTNYTGGNGVSGSSCVSFVVENNSGGPINLTQVAAYFQTASNNTNVKLWYSATSLSGPFTVATPVWTEILSGGPVAIPANGEYDLFSGLLFEIPNGVQYRFALESSTNIRYSGATPVPSPSTFTNGGVTLKGGNEQIAGANIGYGGAFPTPPAANSPRWFTGSITFVPALPCSGTPNAGASSSSASVVCQNQNINLGLTGNTSATGLSYTWQFATNIGGPYTDITTASASSVATVMATQSGYYQCLVSCGANSSTSIPVQVTVNSVFPAGTYTIDNTQPTGGTNFASFTDAFNAINCGVTGAVVFNVAAGQTFSENPPEINFTGSSSASITFQKSGSGANPVIQPANAGNIASTTTLGNNGDGVIVINGGDYITFDGIDINTSNFTSGNDQYEYGYYLKKKSATDASKYVTIKNATITLSKAIYSFGIYVSNNSGTGAVTVTSVGGRSEHIKIDGNTILESYGGIQVRGQATAAYYDKYIEIGVTAGNNITDFAGGATTTYGIYAISQDSLKVANNIISSISSGQTGAISGIHLMDATNANAEVYNNHITIHGGGSATIQGIYSTMGATGTNNLMNFHNNIIENCSAASGSTGAFYGIYLTGTVYKTRASHNIIRSNIITTTGAFGGIYQIGSPVNEVRIDGNRVLNNERSNGTTSVFYGIYNNPTSTTNNYIYNDTVENNISTSSTAIMYGIYQSAGISNRIYNNYVNGLTNNASGTATGGVYGIHVLTGTANTNIHVGNNVVSDLNAPSTNNADAIRGISVVPTGTTSTDSVYYNTVFLNASSGGTDFGTSGLYIGANATATTAALVLKNNNIVNTSTPGGAGVTAAHRRSAIALNNFSVGNNNNFYAGSPSPSNVIFYVDASNMDETMGAYKSRVAPRESSSISENPPFVNSGSAPFDLRINTTVPTQLESGGSSITHVNVDIDGNTRNATTPDIGAYEFNGIGADLTGPGIVYTPFAKQSICIDGKTLTATITDAAGVNVAAGTKPRLWYKKASEADALPATNTSANNGWKYVEATNSASPFTFTMDYSLLTSPVINGDSISYFVVAQDLATTPNVGINAGTFNSNPSSVALGAAAFPVSGNVNGYAILSLPNPITIKVNRTDICASGDVVLDVDGVSLPGAEYQWQRSHHNTNNWSDIPAGTTIPFTYNVTDSSDFRLVVKCGGTPISTSPSSVVTVNVNNPQITGTTPATRCGPGAVTLQATAANGYDIKWYKNATGGQSIGTGGTFNATVNSDSTFYVSAVSVGTGAASIPGDGSWDHVTTTGAFQTTAIASAYMILTVTTPITLSSLDIYPKTSGVSYNIQARPGSVSATALYTYTGTTTVSNPNATPTTSETVPVNWALPAGTYYIGFGTNPNTWRSGTATHTFPWTIPGVVSMDFYLTPSYQYYFYNLQVTGDCEGTRTPVTVSVTAPPALSLVNPNKAICLGAVDSMEVTGSTVDYTSFVWSPTTNLYTDAAGTVPYNGTSAAKVYVKASSEGVTGYTLTANNTATSCSNILLDTINILPSASITATKEEICISGTTVLSLSPSSDYKYGSIQWQSSANGTTYNDINGANGIAYTTPVITSTTYYRALVKGSNGVACSQPAITITVNNPQIVSSQGQTICSPGVVNLTATGSAGSTLNWYQYATGGTPLATGGTFSPTINDDSTFYVAASAGANTISAGKLSPESSATATTLSTYPTHFTVTQAFTLNSVQVHSGTGTSINISLYNAGGTTPVLETTGAIAVTAGTSPVIPLNWTIQPGNYRINASMTGSFYRDGITTPSVVYPMPIGNVGQINGYSSSVTGSLTAGAAYYFLYNWQVTVSCETPRTAVTGIVDAADPACVPVPVTLVNFTGEKRGAINRLSWTTATEVNNAGFELQRSTDGVNFSKLSFVNTKAENGNSTEKLNYFYNDEQPLKGINYYRLKQLDKDGKYDYSGVVKLDGDRVTEVQIVSVYPNPVRDRLNIKLQSPVSKKGTLIVTDAMGKVLMQQAVELVSGDSRLDVNVSRLAQGNYFVKVICADGCTTAIHRFIKE